MDADAMVTSLLAPLARETAGAAMDQAEHPSLIHFDQGLPDPELFPVELLRAELDAALADGGASVLTYFGDGGPSEMRLGDRGLRRTLAGRMAERDGRSVGADNVLLANGSTDGLALAVRAFLGPGDGAVVESATYRHTRNFMRVTGADVRATPLDDHGLRIDGLEQTLDQFEADGVRPKLIYTIPTFHAPTGTVLPEARRAALVELAERRQVMILEDNCYYALHYDEPPPPTLFARDGCGMVILSDSFSKYLAPGLRLGWLAAHPAAIEAMARVRQDFAVSRLLANAIDRIVCSGRFDQHLGVVRESYRAKRDLTARLLQERCGSAVQFTAPSGGFFFWIRLADGVATDFVHRELQARGVAVRGGEWFTDDEDGAGYLRLSPMQLDEHTIERGISILGDVVTEAARITST